MRGRRLLRLGSIAMLCAPALAAAQGEAAAGEPLPETEVDVFPRMLAYVQPEYPDQFKAQKVEGTVVLQAVVGVDGKVEPGSVQVLQGLHPVLEQSAQAALLATEFTPAEHEGRPVRVLVQTPYTFRDRAPGERGSRYARVRAFGADRTADSETDSARGSIKLAWLWKRLPVAGVPGQVLEAFSPGDTLSLYVMAQDAFGEEVFARWYFQELGGRTFVAESRFAVAHDSERIDFSAARPEPWPAGRYEVDVGIGDTVLRTLAFRVVG